MAAIVSGLAAGLELSSRAVLGSVGPGGQAAAGRNGESVYVNVARGSLVVQNRDEQRVARGADFTSVRTYDSNGLFDGDNGDRWRADRVSVRLVGPLQQAGSFVERTDRDGSVALYGYDAARGLYVTTEGEGAHDTIAYIAADAQFEWRDGGTGVTQRFEAAGAGRILSSRDPAGNAQAYGYDASGLLRSVSSSNGDATFYDYEGTKLTQIRVVVDGVSTTSVRYAYDAANRLATVTVDLSPGDGSIADGRVYQTHYAYDGASTRLSRITQSDGSSLAITYVDAGGGNYRVASLQDALGNTTRFAYGSGFATVTDALGFTTRYEFDAKGQLTRIVPPGPGGSAAARRFAYAANGDLLSVTDGAGQVVTFGYDANGNEILRRDAAGQTVTRTFDARNQLLTETTWLQPDPDAAGPGQPGTPLTTRFVYEATPRALLRFEVAADGAVTEHRYDGFGQRVETIAYAGAWYPVEGIAPAAMVQEASLAAWATAQEAGGLQRITRAYDSRGELQSRTLHGTDGSASTERYVHDSAGRLLQVIAADGGTTTHAYDGLGRVIVTTDALGHARVTRHDDGGRKTVVTLAGGLVRTSAYDAAGRLIAVTESDLAGTQLGETRYFHDAAGRLRMVRDATGVRTSFFHDEAGRKIGEVDGTGTLTEYRYDGADRLVETRVRSASVNTALLVDAAGQPAWQVTLAQIRPPDGPSDRATWSEYDAAGRLARIAQHVGTGARAAVTEYRYDGASRLVAVVRYANTVAGDGSAAAAAPGRVPLPPASAEDRVTRHFHDAAGRLVGTLDAEGFLTVHRYTAAGQHAGSTAYAAPADPARRATGTLAELMPAAGAGDRSERRFHDGKGQAVGHLDAEGYLTETVYDAQGRIAQTIRYANRATLPDAATLAGARPAASSADRVLTRSYDLLGRLVRETDGHGVQTRYAYDAEGRLVSTTRAADTDEARTLMVRYDAQGRRVGELSAEGAALLDGEQTAAEIEAIWSSHGTTHTYDAASRRTSSIDPLGRRTWFFYDADGALTHTVNALGEVQETRYDGLGEVREQIAYTARISTDGLEGGLATATLLSRVAAIGDASRDARTTFTLTRDGRVATRTDAEGAVTSFAYNAFGDELRRELAGAGTSLVETHAVDRRGMRVSTTRDAGGVNAVFRTEHDAFGQVVRAHGANGEVHETAHDRLGRIVATRDPLGGLRSATYDAFSRVLTQTDALGHATTYAYDDAARALVVTTPEGVVTTTIHNRHGQVHTVRDGTGELTTFRYDRDGRLVQTTAPLATTTRNIHDAAGFLRETVDASGNRVLYAYDAANRVLSRRVDPDGLDLVTTYAYDGQGRRVAVTDANGVLTTIEYDRKGRVLRQTVDPAGLRLQTVHAYDARDNVLSVTTPGGTRTEYVYDSLGRRIRERVDPSGLNLERSWAYDAAGNVTASTDARGQVTRHAYDGAGRLVFTVGPAGAVRRNRHDAEGRIVETVAYARPLDVSLLPAAATIEQIAARVVAQPAQDQVEHRVLDDDGRLLATVDGVGAVVRFTYDERGLLLERVAYAQAIDLASWVPGTAPVVEADPARDARTTILRDALGREQYTIDGTGAVTRHVHDANGNLVQQVRYAARLAEGGDPWAMEAGAEDRVTSFAYDAANRLVFQVDALGVATESAYDAEGRVVRRTTYARALETLPEDGTSAAEAIRAMVVPDGAMDRTTRYTYDAAGRPVLTVHADGGVVEQRWDAAGNLVARHAYANALDPTVLGDDMDAVALRAMLVGSPEDDRVTRYAHDAAGRRVYEVDAHGGVTRFRQDAAGLLIETRRYAVPVSVAVQADAATLAAAVVESASDRTELHAYDAAGHRIATTDAAGGTESWTRDGLGRALTFTDRAGAVWTYTYDAAGRMKTETSPPVSVTTVSFSGGTGSIGVGAATEVRITTLFVHDALGNLLARTEAAGRPEERTTRYVYDAVGHQVGVIYPEVGVYDAASDALTSNTGVSPRSEQRRVLESRTWYNAFGEAVASRDVGGGLAQKVYDGAGRLLYDIDALGFVTGYGYGSFGEAISLTRHAASTTLAARPLTDAAQVASREEVETALSGSTGARTLHTAYDRMGRVAETWQPRVFVHDATLADSQFDAEARTRNTYNAFGDLVESARSRDEAGHAWFRTTHYVDRLGRRTATVDAMGYLTTHGYDTFGNLVQATEHAVALAPGAWTLQSHGTAAASQDDRIVRHGYDVLGRRTSDTRVDVEYSTGPSGASVRGDLATTFAYDAVGNQTAVTDALGRTTWTYHDALGRIRAVAAPLTGSGTSTLTVFQRDAHGNVALKTEHATPAQASAAGFTTPGASSSDRVTATAYDVLGRATAQRDANGAMAFSSFDAHGNLAKSWRGVTDGAGVTRTQFQVNVYDALGRLVETKTPASTAVVQGGVKASYTPAPNPRLASVVPAWGINQLKLEWSNFIALGGGNVRVEVDYMAGAILAVPHAEGGSSARPAQLATHAQEFTAAAAAGGAELTWNVATDGVVRVRILQMEGGRWKELWDGPLAQAAGSGGGTLTQAQAGLVHASQQFNAFGEMTRRGTQGGKQEYFEYDDAGRLWRTNSGDGVDKVYLYDLQGNVTSEIRSAGAGGLDQDIRAYAGAAAASADPYTRRIDTQYDALGHVTSRTESRRALSQAGVSVESQFVTASIQRIPWVQEGMHEITLSWVNLRALGSGDIRVEIEYLTPVVRVVSGPDEYGNSPPVAFTGGVKRAYATQLLVGDEHRTGATLRWVDPDGVGQIVRVRVLMKGVDGNQHPVIDQAPGRGGHQILVGAPADPQTRVTLETRLEGSTTWKAVSLIDFGDRLRYDATLLGPGKHEYRVLQTPADQSTVKEVARGSVEIRADLLARITTPITFGQATRPYLGSSIQVTVAGALSWAHQDFSLQQVLRYRPAGSTQAWKTLPIELFSNGHRDGVDCTSLAAGTYEFELLWTPAGEGVPTQHATGRFQIVARKPSTWVPPVGVPPIGGFILQRVSSYGPNEVLTYQNILSWPAINADLVRVKIGSTWKKLTINNNAVVNGGSLENGPSVQQVSLASLGPGTYDIEVRVTAAGKEKLGKIRYVVSATGKGSFTNITPTYKPGYWTAEVPASYGVSISTPAASGAISAPGGMQVTPVSAWNAGTEWQRPIVVQNTDRWGNVVAISDPRSANWVTTYRYNWSDQLVQQALPVVSAAQGAPVTRIYYDALGRQVAVRDAKGNVEGRVWDAAGNLLEERHADGGVVRHAYDALGRKTETVDAMGNAVAFRYDRMGNLLAADKGMAYVYRYDGVTLQSKTLTRIEDRWTYDELGRKLSHTNGNGEKLTYVYDLRGNVVETTQPLGQKTRAAFDVHGRKIAEVDANGIAAYWTYDYFGQLKSHVDLGGARHSYSYDHARQLVLQKSTRGQHLAFSHDTAGQLVLLHDVALNQKTMYAYDEAGRRVRERVIQDGITYQDNHLAYDALGNLRDVADARVHIRMDYDLVGNREFVGTYVHYAGTVGSVRHDVDRYYKYDAMNRQVVVDAPSASGAIDASGGHIITYDKNGNRTSDATAAGKETYEYDALNRIKSVLRGGTLVDARHYDGADRLVHSGATATENTYSRYDANGRLLRQVMVGPDGSLRTEASWDTGQAFSGKTPDGYDGVGNAKGYVVRDLQSGAVTEFSTSFARFEGHQADVIQGSSTVAQAGSTLHAYDANGFLVSVTDTTKPANNRTFVNDAQGRALYVNQQGHVQRQLIVNGEVLGIYGAGVDPDRPLNGGNPNFANLADFGFGYAPITASHPDAAPGAYIVRPGDTLQAIAQGAYGDSALWYRIAEANGLASTNDLKVGQTLNIPNRVGTIHNNATTFEPYDPSRILGDTTPNLPMPGKEGCGGLGQVVMVVVAIVATIYTAGAAAGALGSAAASAGTTLSAWGTGLAALGGGSAAGVTIGAGAVLSGTAASVVGAAVGGAVGSIASQAIGVGIGAVDRFSWKSVGLSAIAGGATAGVGAYAGAATNASGLLTGTGPQAVVARAVVSNAITQGVVVAMKMQRSFDWRGVAAAAVGAGVGHAASSGFANAFDPGGLAHRFATGLTAGLAAAAMRGGKVVVQQVAVDAFGNAFAASHADSSVAGPRGREANDRNALDIKSDLSSPAYDYEYRNAMDRASDAVHALASGWFQPISVGVQRGGEESEFAYEYLIGGDEASALENVFGRTSDKASVGAEDNNAARVVRRTDKINAETERERLRELRRFESAAQLGDFTRSASPPPTPQEAAELLAKLPPDTALARFERGLYSNDGKPSITAWDWEADNRASVDLQRRRNNIAIHAGGPLVGGPMLAARQLGADEFSVENTGIQAASFMDLYAPRGPSVSFFARVRGARPIDYGRTYETEVRSLYGDLPFQERTYSAFVNGQRVNGVADSVAIISGRSTAVEAKFVHDWGTSLRNPASPEGGKPWAVLEQQKMVDQALKYSHAFDRTIYHTNSVQLANHYAPLFQKAGAQNFEFVITPSRQ